MANLIYSSFVSSGVFYEGYADLQLSTFTMSAEPLAWRWERMCRDAGRVLFGNILTID